MVRFLYKIGRLSKILKIRICFPCGGRFCPKVIPLGAFWQYSGTKRNTREPFHKHKVGLLGTNVHHVGLLSGRYRKEIGVLFFVCSMICSYCFVFSLCICISLPFASWPRPGYCSVDIGLTFLHQAVKNQVKHNTTQTEKRAKKASDKM